MIWINHRVAAAKDFTRYREERAAGATLLVPCGDREVPNLKNPGLSLDKRRDGKHMAVFGKRLAQIPRSCLADKTRQIKTTCFMLSSSTSLRVFRQVTR
jgi:hypothetical protein